MTRVILEFDSPEHAQAFVDSMDGYVYWDPSCDDWESAEASIAADSPVQPTAPKTVAELRKERREHKKEAARGQLAAYVASRLGNPPKELF